MALTNTNWLTGSPKNVNEQALSQISSFLTLGNEVELSVVNDLTKAMCVYEYGPALSLLELEHFMNQLTNKVSMLRNHNEELFCQFFNCICDAQAQNFVIRNTCVMIFKPPKCILVKFGQIETIKYVIHLDNNCLYKLGTNDEPIPFIQDSSQQLKEKYLALKSKVAQKVGLGLLDNLEKFEKSLDESIANSIKSIDETTEHKKKLLGATSEITVSIEQNYEQSDKLQEEVNVGISKVQARILNSGKNSSKTRQNNVFDYADNKKKQKEESTRTNNGGNPAN